MTQDFRHLEYELHESIVQIQSALQLAGQADSESYQALEDVKHLIADKTYVLAVMGEFKRGKSSLINALMGNRVLPADVEPTTATLNRITYATKPQVSVRYHDGLVQEVPIADLASFVSKQGLNGRTQAEDIDEVTIGYPVPFTQNHIDIYDTPGLNDDERMTAIAVKMVEKADMVLVPLSALAPYSEVEQDFVCKLIRNENIDRVMFVVTFLDMLGEDGIDYNYQRFMYGHGGVAWRIKELTFQRLAGDEEALAKAHAMLDDLDLCAVSSRQALKAYAKSDAQLLKESRFEEFRSLLTRSLTARQSIATAHKVGRVVAQVGQDLQQSFDEGRRERAEELARCRDAIGQLSRWQEELRPLTNEYLARAIDKIEQELPRAVSLRDELTRSYIVQLASLRTGSALAVRRAVRLADMSRQERMDAYLAQVKKAHQDALVSLLNEVAQHEADLVDDLDYVAQVRLLSGNAQLKTSIVDRIGDALARVQIDWRDPLAPLMDYEVDACDPIDLLSAEVTRSLTQLDAQLENVTAAARAACLGGLNSYAKALARWAREFGGRASEEASRRLKAFEESQGSCLAHVQDVVDEVTSLVAQVED